MTRRAASEGEVFELIMACVSMAASRLIRTFMDSDAVRSHGSVQENETGSRAAHNNLFGAGRKQDYPGSL
jgi:hypothetical protein